MRRPWIITSPASSARLETVVRGAVSGDVAHRIEEAFGKRTRGSVRVKRATSTSGKHGEKYVRGELRG